MCDTYFRNYQVHSTLECACICLWLYVVYTFYLCFTVNGMNKDKKVFISVRFSCFLTKQKFRDVIDIIYYHKQTLSR